MPAKRSTNLNDVSLQLPEVTAPSFAGFRASSSISAKIKSRNRSTDTKAELKLRKALWTLGLRYRLHVPELAGRPDIVFPKARVAVFCDGDFWHGRDWPSLHQRLSQGHNARYWLKKIAYNIARDDLQTRELEKRGWAVVRHWETDVLQNANYLAKQLANLVKKRSRVRDA